MQGVAKSLLLFLRTAEGQQTAPWQLEILAQQRLPGRPTIETYRRLKAALDTVRPESR